MGAVGSGGEGGGQRGMVGDPETNSYIKKANKHNPHQQNNRVAQCMNTLQVCDKAECSIRSNGAWHLSCLNPLCLPWNHRLQTPCTSPS